MGVFLLPTDQFLAVAVIGMLVVRIRFNGADLLGLCVTSFSMDMGRWYFFHATAISSCSSVAGILVNMTCCFFHATTISGSGDIAAIIMYMTRRFLYAAHDRSDCGIAVAAVGVRFRFFQMTG